MSALKVAVGYVRCSTEMQEDSPDQQKKEILAFAAKQGYEIVEWFIDFGKSGTTFDQRPEFQRLRAAVDHGPSFQAVMCYDESRWGRAIDSAENTYWRVYFRKQGVEVLLVKTAIDPMHEYAPMLQSFESIQASQYSKKLSELTLRGAKNNGQYSSGGSAPYGYQRIAVNTKTGAERVLGPGDWLVSGQEKVKFAPGDPEEIRIVKSIFEQRFAGRSYTLILKQLNSEGIPCAKRGRWRNKDQKWSNGTIKAILENHSYYGARVYNRNSMSKILAQRLGRPLQRGVKYPHWKNDPVDWVIVEGAHDAIVSKELWEKVNSIKPMNKARCKPRHEVPYLLTGLIQCSKCGFPFQGQSTKSKGHHYYRYVCGGHNAKRVCTWTSIDKDSLESFVIASVKGILMDPTLIDMVESLVKHLVQTGSECGQAELDRLHQMLVENERAKSNLIDTIQKAGPIESLVSRLSELEQETAKAKEKIAAIQVVCNKNVPDDLRGEIVRFIGDFEHLMETAPIYERRELIRKCVSKIFVDREESVARCFVRQLPAVNAQIMELYEAEETRLENLTGEELRRVYVTNSQPEPTGKMQMAAKKPPLCKVVVAGTRSDILL